MTASERYAMALMIAGLSAVWGGVVWLANDVGLKEGENDPLPAA